MMSFSLFHITLKPNTFSTSITPFSGSHFVKTEPFSSRYIVPSGVLWIHRCIVSFSVHLKTVPTRKSSSLLRFLGKYVILKYLKIVKFRSSSRKIRWKSEKKSLITELGRLWRYYDIHIFFALYVFRGDSFLNGVEILATHLWILMIWVCIRLFGPPEKVIFSSVTKTRENPVEFWAPILMFGVSIGMTSHKPKKGAKS